MDFFCNKCSSIKLAYPREIQDAVSDLMLKENVLGEPILRGNLIDGINVIFSGATESYLLFDSYKRLLESSAAGLGAVPKKLEDLKVKYMTLGEVNEDDQKFLIDLFEDPSLHLEVEIDQDDKMIDSQIKVHLENDSNLRSTSQAYWENLWDPKSVKHLEDYINKKFPWKSNLMEACEGWFGDVDHFEQRINEEEGRFYDGEITQEQFEELENRFREEISKLNPHIEKSILSEITESYRDYVYEKMSEIERSPEKFARLVGNHGLYTNKLWINDTYDDEKLWKDLISVTKSLSSTAEIDAIELPNGYFAIQTN